MNNFVQYKHWWLSRNSEAYSLLEKKEFKKLDSHMREVEQKRKDLENNGTLWKGAKN